MRVIINKRVASRQGKCTLQLQRGKKDTHKTLLINPRFFVALFCQGLIYDIKHSNEIKTVREGEGGTQLINTVNGYWVMCNFLCSSIYHVDELQCRNLMQRAVKEKQLL